MTSTEEVLLLVDANQNYNVEEHERIRDDLDVERSQRIAGDAAVTDYVEVARIEAATNSTGLSTEAILRVEGDLLSQQQYEALIQAFNGEWGAIKLSVVDMRIEFNDQLVVLGNRITVLGNAVDFLDESLTDLIYQTKDQLETNLNSLNTRVHRYEQMLSDITMDSTQITMDNGEINLGAWTILSQAREWDLQIIASFKDLKIETEDYVNNALDEFNNNLPNANDIVNEVLGSLSNTPVIKDLNDLLNGTIEDVNANSAAIQAEELARAQAILVAQQQNLNLINQYTDTLSGDIAANASAQTDAVQREATIRAAALVLEAQLRSEEIEERTGQIDIDIAQDIADLNNRADSLHQEIVDESAVRLADVTALNNGLTQEIQQRIDGDNASISALANYKASNDVALANIRTDISANVTATAANASRIDSLDTRLTLAEGEGQATKQIAASALTKAETALTATEALATQMTAVNASIDGLEDAIITKADAAAFNLLVTKVDTIDGKVTTNTSDLTSLKSTVTNLTGTVTGHTSAISQLESTQIIQGNQITQLTTDTTALKNSVTTIQGDLTTKVDSTAFNQLSTKVDNNTNTNTTQSTAITKLQGDLAITDGKVATKAEAAALQTLDTKVTAIDGKVTTNTAAITSLSSRVTTVEGSLTNKVDASVLVNYYTKTQTDTAIAGQITTFNSSLRIGGTNLYMQTKDFTGAWWSAGSTVIDASQTYKGLAVRKSTGQWNGIKQIFPIATFPIGTKVILSLYAKGETDGQPLGVYSNGTSGAFLVGGSTNQVLLTTAWKRYAFIATINSDTVTIQLRPENPLTTGTVYLCGLQFEVANVPSEWSPAPEDTLTYLNEKQTAIDANATSINTTNTEVSRINGVVISQGSAITSLTARVTTAEGNLAVKADSSALQTLDTKVTAIDGRVTNNANAITSLTNRVTIVEGTVTTKADVSAVNALTTRVTTAENNITVNTNSITTLKATLDSAISGLTITGTKSALEQIQNPTAGFATLVANSTAMSGSVLHFGDNVGNDGIPVLFGQAAAIDINKLYKVKYRYRRVTGTGTVYIGLFNLSADKLNGVSNANELISPNTISSGHYFVSNMAPALGVWTEGVYYFKGKAAAASTGTGTIASPKTFANLSAYYRLGILPNYASQTGEVELDYLIIEDAEAIVNAEGNATAITNLTTTVTQQGNTITTLSSDVTTLKNNVTTINGTLTTKADNSALVALTTRVTNTEGTVANQATQLTNLTADLSTANGKITANTTAISTLDTKVTNVDGKVTTNTNAITTLSGRVTTVEGNMVNKVDASVLNNYYTKVQSDTAMAGQISTFNASLQVGTGNQYSKTKLYTGSPWIHGNTIADEQTYKGLAVRKSSGQWAGPYQNLIGELYPVGTKLIFSLYAKGETNGQLMGVYVSTATTTSAVAVGGTNNQVALTTEWKRYAFAVTVIGTTNIQIRPENPLTTGTIYSCGLQVEIGTVPSDWSETTTEILASGSELEDVVIDTTALDPNTYYAVITKLPSVGQSYLSIENNLFIANGKPAWATHGSGFSLRLVWTSNGSGYGGVGVQRHIVDFTHSFTTQSPVFNVRQYNNSSNEAVYVRGGAKYNFKVTRGLKPTLLTADLVVSEQTIPYTVVYDANLLPKTSDSLITANASALTTTNAEVTRINGVVISQGTSITNLTASVANKADASAVTSLQATVTAQGNSITNLSNQTTTLTNRVTTAEGNITANTNSFNTLNNKVTDIDGRVTAQATSITQVEATLNSTNSFIISTHRNGSNIAGTLNQGLYNSKKTLLGTFGRGLNLLVWNATGTAATITSYDTYATLDNALTLSNAIEALAANTYFTVVGRDNLGNVSTHTTLKNSIIANGGSADYFAKWTGNYIPIFTTKKGQFTNTGIQHSFSSTVTNDGIAYVLNMVGGVPDGLAGATPIDESKFAAASALTTLDAKVTVIDGKVTTQASSLTQLQSTVDGNTASLVVQGNVLNGIQSEYSIKLDVNGLVSGIGLINTGTSSAIGMNADYFYVGNPANNKKPFMILTTPQTINGVTYPAGTWIDVALIANATIGTAHIKDASITTAKIEDLAVSEAKISNLAVTNAKIANATIEGAKIKDAAITAAKIDNAAITTAKIADAAIESAKIADAAIVTAKIANAAITTAKIGDLQVDTLKIKDNAVTVPLFLEDANMISYRYASGTFVVGEVVLTGIKQGERVMVQMYAQSASGGIELRNADSGGYAFAYVFLNDVQQAVIRTGADSSYYESNNAEGGGGGGTTVVIGNAFVAFGTNPTVYAFVSPTDNPKITVKVNSTKWFYIVKNVPLVFTTIGLKK